VSPLVSEIEGKITEQYGKVRNLDGGTKLGFMAKGHTHTHTHTQQKQQKLLFLF